MELVNGTEILLKEIASKACTKRHVAQTYALAIRSRYPTDWAQVNAAIMARWSISALNDIKRMAWSGTCFANVNH